LIIDPTPPHASPGGVVATFDPSDNSVDVSWADATDPTLPDGTPGAVAGYTVQYSIGTGPYGYPIDTDGPSFSIPDQVEGEVVNVWVVTTDAAGRKSLERESNDANEFMTGSDTATRATMTPEAIGESDDGESGDADIPTVDTSDYDPTSTAATGPRSGGRSTRRSPTSAKTRARAATATTGTRRRTTRTRTTSRPTTTTSTRTSTTTARTSSARPCTRAA
jgi:hypothetical protein